MGGGKASEEFGASAGNSPKEHQARKKKVKWLTTFGSIEISEQLLRLGRRGPELRPFCQAAGVQHRGYSKEMQRVLVDFGGEHSFVQAAARVREHYRIEVPVQAIREHTLRHGRKINPLPEKDRAAAANTLITQMDGSMIPMMESGKGRDRRKGKRLFWREARLCMARGSGRVSGIYGVTLGTSRTAGWLWGEVATAAGLNAKTYVHGLGDGAGWIVEQFKENFSDQGRYLLDFYHVSEYLAAAAPRVVKTGKEKQWRHRQQGRLLNNQVKKVLRSLRTHLEPTHTKEAPVRSAYGYLQERVDQLDYAGARAKDLPIGSGEIESGHRHVIQQRLKRSGCWWKESNAQAMLNLRVARTNNLWKTYWPMRN